MSTSQSAASARPKRISQPSAKLTDSSNVAEPELRSHMNVRAINVANIISSSIPTATGLAAADDVSSVATSGTLSQAYPPLGNSPFPCTPPRIPSPPLDNSEENENNRSPSPSVKKRKHTRNCILVTSDDDDVATSSKPPSSKKSKKRKLSRPPDVSDADNSEPEIVETMESKTRDIDAFFKPCEKIGGKRKRCCELCSKRRAQIVYIVQDATTLRRHIEAHHKHQYDEWCKKNDFQSKLPKAVRSAKEEKDAQDRAKQSALDPHLKERVPQERVLKYTHEDFRQAAIEWLVETDQPIQALEHPSFHKMINIAARATNGVRIPDRKATRKYIMDLFKKNMSDLRRRLSSNSTGLISLTCDAWQASTTDAYFAVTGHWNEKMPDGTWEQQTALLGFTRLNCAHDGASLGRSLFDIVKRLRFGHKVGWITCDNASNNMTMLEHFSKILNASKMRNGCKHQWSWRVYHIRCLAHIINLATQALIGTYSKSGHFNPHEPTEHEPDLKVETRDEVGLVRAVAVKARSSAKRKECLKELQVKAARKPLTLILDMKVRWSSTLAMLKRALDLRDVFDAFIKKMAKDESDKEKREKLKALELSEEEWDRVETFVELLEYADNSQQAFSYDSTPSLHNALPALEALHTVWSKRLETVTNDLRDAPKYKPFSTALVAGIDKICEYYDKSATSQAYTFVMLLNPDSKMDHFKKYWSPNLQAQVRESAEVIFKARYLPIFLQNPSVGFKLFSWPRSGREWP